MRIEGYSQFVTPALIKVSALQNWSIGQIISANVIGRASENSILIELGGETVQAKTQLPISAGQTLVLRVVTTVPNIVLSVVGTTTPPREVITAAMNESLPRREPMNALGSAISAAIAQTTTKANASTTVAMLARSMLDALPAPEPLADPQGLRKAFVQSGIMLEATLARSVLTGTTAQPVEDLKGYLLKLSAVLGDLAASSQADASSDTSPRAPLSGPASQANHTAAPPSGTAPPPASGASTTVSAPPTLAPANTHPAMEDAALPKLAQAIDGALARIETNQLTAAHAQLSGQVYVVTEIPMRVTSEHLQFMRIEIEADAQQDDKARSGRELGLNIVLEVPVSTTQTISARIRLAEPHVAVTVWSEDVDLQRRIDQRCDELATNLAQAGFTVSSVLLGRVSPIADTGHLPSRLIDAKV